MPLHINSYCDSVGPLTSTLVSLPLAQPPQYFECLLHSTAEKTQSLHQVRKPSSMPSASASATAYASTSYFKNFNIIFNNLPSTLATSTLKTHIFTDSTSALNLSNKLGLNKYSKHIALRYLFAQDIQATGLVNIQRATPHNSPADIYTKCVTSPVLERHLQHNRIIELHIEEGKINYFHILELAAQYINDADEESATPKSNCNGRKTTMSTPGNNDFEYYKSSENNSNNSSPIDRRADIMADILFRKKQRQLRHRSSSSPLGGGEGEGGEDESRRRVRTPSPTQQPQYTHH